jgi:hypothetical protein
MPPPDEPSLELGQRVRRRDDPSGKIGVVVGVLFQPLMALVRWSESHSTFESLDSLVEVIRSVM